jgi:hypothetical protein
MRTLKEMIVNNQQVRFSFYRDGQLFRLPHSFSLSRRFGVFIDINASQSPSLQS